MAVIETPFILHPTLERITPPDALRPYTPIPNGKPNDKQNGMFSPIDWKGIRQEEMRKQIQQQMLSNDPVKDMQKEFANRVLLGPNNHPNETAKSETVAGVNSKPKTNKQKSDEAAQKNKDWVTQYRQKFAGAKTPLDPVSVNSQVNVALRDPVYGQATATGLTMGNNILNTWINAHNADARREAEELKTERWLKQLADTEEDKQYQRKWSEEERAHQREREKLSDKRFIGAESFDPLLNVSSEDKAEYAKMISDPLFGAQIVDNPLLAAQIEDKRNKRRAEIAKWTAERNRSVMPSSEDRAKMNAALKKEALSKEDFTEGFGVLDSAGRESSGGFLDRLLRDSPFQIAVSKNLEAVTGNKNTIKFDNIAQYQNMLSKTGRIDEARQVGKIIKDALIQGLKIEELVGSPDPNAPLYMKTNKGVYIITPDLRFEPDIQFKWDY